MNSRRRRRDARDGRVDGRQGHLSASVSDARIDGHRRARSPTCRTAKRRSGRRRSRRIRCAAASAMLLGLQPDDVRVVFTRGAGCYGMNGADTVSYDAALLSQAVGRPVRVQLSRKDEMAWENYGFAYVDRSARRRRRRRHDRRVGLRGVVRLARRPSRLRTPGNVDHRHARRLRAAARSRRRRRAEPAGEFRNGSNAAPSYVAGRVAAQRAAAPAPSRASACSRTRSRRRSSPARCARRRACRTRSRTNASSTRSRRT